MWETIQDMTIVRPTTENELTCDLSNGALSVPLGAPL